VDPFESLLENFHKVPVEERVLRVASWCGLHAQDLDVLSGRDSLSLGTAEHLIENVVGIFPLPLGIATYFNIDGRDVLIPMAVEESSIIAAISSTARWIRRNKGTIRTEARGRRIIGQIQIPRSKNPAASVQLLNDARDRLIAEANNMLPNLCARGGGIDAIEVRQLERADHGGEMLVIHFLCNPCDAMGANIINQVCEGMKPAIEALTGEKVGLCILSNLVDGNLAFAEVRIDSVDDETAYGIEEATEFAKTDPYRATTHNKGVLNGIDPILIATGNDWRAVESGIHAYAARSGKYQPVTEWKREGKTLVGRFEAPIAVGTVGGVTSLHPTSKIAMKILGVQHADELARICAAAGLVQNLGALKALATVGIVKGHMRLHAANLAMAAGATREEMPLLRERLTQLLNRERRINLTMAKEVLSEIRGN